MPNLRILSCHNGNYDYRLNGRVESLPLRPNHFHGEGGISNLSTPAVVGRNRRRVTYTYKGETWTADYARRTPGGPWYLQASYVVAKAA